MNKLPKRTPLRAIASVILAQDVHQPKELKAGGASEGSAMPWPRFHRASPPRHRLLVTAAHRLLGGMHL